MRGCFSAIKILPPPEEPHRARAGSGAPPSGGGGGPAADIQAWCRASTPGGGAGCGGEASGWRVCAGSLPCVLRDGGCRRLLSMRCCFSAIKILPHPEETDRAPARSGVSKDAQRRCKDVTRVLLA